MSANGTVTAYSIKAILRAPQRLLDEIPLEDQTEALCLALITSNPGLLGFMRRQTPKVVRAALRRSSSVLRYVEDQSEDVCLLAVQENGCMLSQVRQPTLAIILAAIEEDSFSLEYVNWRYDRISEAGSGQLDDWRRILQICEYADQRAMNKTLAPLMQAVPLGERYLDAWRETVRPGVTLLDLLLEVVAHLQRLSPEDERVKVFAQRVAQQVEMTLKAGEAPVAARSWADSLEPTL